MSDGRANREGHSSFAAEAYCRKDTKEAQGHMRLCARYEGNVPLTMVEIMRRLRGDTVGRPITTDNADVLARRIAEVGIF